MATCHTGQMTPLPASSPTHSLVECVGLHPCERHPRLAVTGQTLPAGALVSYCPGRAVGQAGDRVRAVARWVTDGEPAALEPVEAR